MLIKCQNCGNEVDCNDAVCSRCGSTIIITEQDLMRTDECQTYRNRQKSASRVVLGVMLAIVLISIIAVVAISTKSNVGGNKQGKKPAEASIYTDDKEKPSSQHTKDKPSQKEFENYAKILGELFCDAFGDEAYYFVSGDTVFMSMDVDISRRELVSYLAESSFVESYKVLREAIVSACKTTYDTFERDGYDDYNVYICVGTNDGCEIVTAYNGQKMFDLYENEYKD